MASYEEWNRQILAYTIGGVPLGSSVYLAIDDDALIDIGSSILSSADPLVYLNDFRTAVRSRCVKGDKVRIESLVPRQENVTIPPYMAFLAATVLAAQHMSDEEEISQADYFTRLNEILGLSVSGGRPPGLSTGSEEELWKHWNSYLRRKGFLPSARHGVGPRRYIQYPISQTLLREADKDNLWRLFATHNWPNHLDEEMIAARIRRSATHLNKHLQRQLEGTDVDSQSRYQALLYEIYDVYEDWQSHGGEYRNRERVSSRLRSLSAGLYRAQEPFSTFPSYYLFPRQARRIQLQNGQLTYKDQVYTLQEERPGWYSPLWEITYDEISGGLQIEVEGDEVKTRLVLPSRQFWIFVSDPDFPESGSHATWARPSLGESFVLLYLEHLQKDLDLLRDEGLIQWQDEPMSHPSYPGWLELSGVMVVSNAWSGIHIENTDLYESLRPTLSISISLTGGLRLRDSRQWIVGNGPSVTVYSFHRHVHISIRRGDDADVEESRDVLSGKAIDFAWSTPGDYQIEVSSGDAVTEKLVKIADWTELPIAPIMLEAATVFDSVRVFGALVSQDDSDS